MSIKDFCDKLVCGKLSLVLPIVVFVYYLDQLTKYLVNFCVLPGQAYEELRGGFHCNLASWIEWLAAPRVSVIAPPGFSYEVLPFFNLAMVWNYGVTFGLFSQDSAWPLIIFSALIVLVLVVWLFKVPMSDKFVIIGLSLVIGGALGNIADRVRYGAVVDFLDFHLGGWHYPAFNVADMAIVLGIAILLYDGLILERKREQHRAKKSDETK